jgi:hypothetical protein
MIRERASMLSYTHVARFVFASYRIAMWPVWLYHIIPRYPINGEIFGKKVIEHKLSVLIFCTNFV